MIETKGMTLTEAAKALTEGETNVTANLANIAALVYSRMADVSWAGFYIADGESLVLGPFQGLPACVRIPFGKGVCGTAARLRETLVVRDVNSFPGHIACDSASQSEIVAPIIKNGEVFGVLDIDSHLPARFGEGEERAVKELAAFIGEIV